MESYLIQRSPSDFRTMAREHLKNKWVQSAIATLSMSIVSFIPSIILSVMIIQDQARATYYQYANQIFSILVSPPLTLGLVTYFIKVSRKQETTIPDIFSGFQHYLASLKLYLYMMFFIVLWSLLLLIPGIIAAFRYALSFYILSDHPEMKTSEIVNLSKEMMHGNKGKFFVLNLSFIGWVLLAILTCGIGLLFVIPYMQTAFAGFYEEVKQSYQSSRPAEV